MSASIGKRSWKGVFKPRSGPFDFTTTWSGTQFFVKDKEFTDMVEAVSYQVAGRVGARVRLRAMSSIRNSKARYRTAKSMPRALQIIHRAARHRWHKGGHRWPEPQLPLKPSRKGKPPRNRTGHLKRNIGYSAHRTGVFTKTWGVVIGPRLLGNPGAGGKNDNWGDIPRLMELGGRGYDGLGEQKVSFPARPYMYPALKKITPKVGKFTLSAMRRVRIKQPSKTRRR